MDDREAWKLHSMHENGIVITNRVRTVPKKQLVSHHVSATGQHHDPVHLPFESLQVGKMASELSQDSIKWSSHFEPWALFPAKQLSNKLSRLPDCHITMGRQSNNGLLASEPAVGSSIKRQELPVTALPQTSSGQDEALHRTRNPQSTDSRATGERCASRQKQSSSNRRRGHSPLRDALSGDALAWAILAGGAIAAATTVVNKRRKARLPVTEVDASLTSTLLTNTSAAPPAHTHILSHAPTHTLSHTPTHTPNCSDSHFSAISVMHDGPSASFVYGPTGPPSSHLPLHLLARPSASWSAPHHSTSRNRRGHKSRDREKNRDQRRSKGMGISAAASPSRILSDAAVSLGGPPLLPPHLQESTLHCCDLRSQGSSHLSLTLPASASLSDSPFSTALSPSRTPSARPTCPSSQLPTWPASTGRLPDSGVDSQGLAAVDAVVSAPVVNAMGMAANEAALFLSRKWDSMNEDGWRGVTKGGVSAGQRKPYGNDVNPHARGDQVDWQGSEPNNSTGRSKAVVTETGDGGTLQGFHYSADRQDMEFRFESVSQVGGLGTGKDGSCSCMTEKAHAYNRSSSSGRREEVVHLRAQLKRRDEMLLEMQSCMMPSEADQARREQEVRDREKQRGREVQQAVAGWEEEREARRRLEEEMAVASRELRQQAARCRWLSEQVSAVEERARASEKREEEAVTRAEEAERMAAAAQVECAKWRREIGKHPSSWQRGTGSKGANDMMLGEEYLPKQAVGEVERERGEYVRMTRQQVADVMVVVEEMKALEAAKEAGERAMSQMMDEHAEMADRMACMHIELATLHAESSAMRNKLATVQSELGVAREQLLQCSKEEEDTGVQLVLPAIWRKPAVVKAVSSDGAEVVGGIDSCSIGPSGLAVVAARVEHQWGGDSSADDGKPVEEVHSGTVHCGDKSAQCSDGSRNNDERKEGREEHLVSGFAACNSELRLNTAREWETAEEGGRIRRTCANDSGHIEANTVRGGLKPACAEHLDVGEDGLAAAVHVIQAVSGPSCRHQHSLCAHGDTGSIGFSNSVQGVEVGGYELKLAQGEARGATVVFEERLTEANGAYFKGNNSDHALGGRFENGGWCLSGMQGSQAERTAAGMHSCMVVKQPTALADLFCSQSWGDQSMGDNAEGGCAGDCKSTLRRDSSLEELSKLMEKVEVSLQQTI